MKEQISFMVVGIGPNNEYSILAIETTMSDALRIKSELINSTIFSNIKIMRLEEVSV